MHENIKFIFKLIIILLIILCIGIAGYYYIEGWSLIDSVYMTVITLTTVGFSEARPLDLYGKIFTIVYLLLGWGIITYSLVSIGSFLIEGEFKNILKRRKMEKIMKDISKHYILCGLGSTGKYVLEEIERMGRKVVVIDSDEKKLTEALEDRDTLYIVGDATSENILKEAGIERAIGLVASLHSDSDNLMLTITAKDLNPNTRVVARATEESSVKKLYKLGADHVILVNMIGGLRMASVLLRPEVVNFLDVMIRDEKLNLRIEEAMVPKNSKYAGKTLADIQIPKRTGLIVIAVKKNNGEYVFNPKSNQTVKALDYLIVLGNNKQLADLEKIIGAIHPSNS